MKPVVLLTQKFSEDANRFGKGPIYCLKSSYARAVGLAGGIPLLGAGGDPDDYARIADGILFTGGIDLEPARYGQALIADNVTFDRDLDEMEIRLFASFLRLGKPMFGICRGIQTINVAAGGTLWQDMASQIDPPAEHARDRLTERRVHPVQTMPGSLMRQLFGDTLLTNSFHHQAVRDCAAGFRATAHTPGGMIEAIEHESLPIFAVQWHPERMIGDEREGLPDMLPLFQSFIQVCRQHGPAISNPRSPRHPES